MHGAGNDYIYINPADEYKLYDWPELSVTMSDRHTGIGSDGIILALSSERADLKMRMFNADGSEGKMCGNGIRCLVSFAIDESIIEPDHSPVSVETQSGILTVYPNIEEGKMEFLAQIHSEATYAKKINKNETKINWDLDANKVVSHIHGLSSNPGAWFKYENKRFKVLRVKKSSPSGAPGIVLDENLTIGCKSESIQILEIQHEGKNKQSIKDFLRGKKIGKDSILI